jgi:hypothetical protein
MPVMALSGVRISWLMLARKALLATLAFGGVLGGGQLGGALLHQRLEMLAVGGQLLLGELLGGDVAGDRQQAGLAGQLMRETEKIPMNTLPSLRRKRPRS